MYTSDIAFNDTSLCMKSTLTMTYRIVISITILYVMVYVYRCSICHIYEYLIDYRLFDTKKLSGGKICSCFTSLKKKKKKKQ